MMFTCWMSLENASVVKLVFCSRLSMAIIRWNGLLKCRPASRVTSSTLPKVVTIPVYPVSTVAVQVTNTSSSATTTIPAMIRLFFVFLLIISLLLLPFRASVRLLSRITLRLYQPALLSVNGES